MTNIKFRMPAGTQFSLETSEEPSDLTISKLKELISGPDKADAPPSALKLVYRGKILKDENTLDSYGFEDGNTIHVVRSRSSASPTTSTTGTTGTSTPQGNTGGGVPNTQGRQNYSGFGGMGNMQEMLRNPAVAQMVENPEFLRSIIESNPQLNQMMRQNPELAQAMRDPETLRTAMRAAMDPSYMQQMLRNQDAQMAHIQNMPGGLDALRRMQQEYQEPMENAMQDTVEQLTGARSGQEEEDNSNQGNDPSQPLPNPWGGGSTRSTQAQPPSGGGNPMGGMGGMNPFAAMGGMEGAGGADMQSAFGMLQNPQMRQMVTQMMSNPETLNMMEQQNPMLRQLLNSQPGMREMMQNPQMLDSMLSTAASMGGSGGGGGTAPGGSGGNPFAQMFAGGGGGMGAPGTAQGSTTNTSTSETNTATTGGMPDMNAMMQQMMQGGLGGTGTQPSGQPGQAPDFNAMLQGMMGGGMPPGGNTGGQPGNTGGQTQQGGTQQATNVNYEELYATQLAQMREIGLTDTQACINALKQTGGNVEAAINIMFGG